jgi:hypothetical protein
MTGKRAEASNVGAGRAVSEDDPTGNESKERQQEIAEDTRPGSAVGGHKAGQTQAEERVTMDGERRG